jgi:hypothetical protein
MLALIAGSIEDSDNLHHVSIGTSESPGIVRASNTTLIITPLSSM